MLHSVRFTETIQHTLHRQPTCDLARSLTAHAIAQNEEPESRVEAEVVLIVLALQAHIVLATTSTCNFTVAPSDRHRDGSDDQGTSQQKSINDEQHE